MQVADRAANASLLDYLRSTAHRRPVDDAWSIDGYELHCHPDLMSRLEEVGEGLGEVAGAYGTPVLVDSAGVAFGFASGTWVLGLRVPVSVRAEVLDAPGSGKNHVPDLHELNLTLAEELGPDWVAADPWPIDAPGDAGLAQLRVWARAASQYARTLS